MMALNRLRTTFETTTNHNTHNATEMEKTNSTKRSQQEEESKPNTHLLSFHNQKATTIIKKESTTTQRWHAGTLPTVKRQDTTE